MQKGIAKCTLQNDFYTLCARWHVFLFSINVYKYENTNHFRYFLMGAATLFQKSYVVSYGSLRCHRQSDVNIDQCGHTFGKCVFDLKINLGHSDLYFTVVIFLPLFSALKNILVLLAKRNLVELRCPGTALILNHSHFILVSPKQMLMHVCVWQP